MYWSVPVKVSVLGQMPASRLLVPKSDILTTPLYVFTSTLSPCAQHHRASGAWALHQKQKHTRCCIVNKHPFLITGTYSSFTPLESCKNQGCGSGSALIWVAGSGSRRAKWPTNIEKSKEFSCLMFSFESWRFPVACACASLWRSEDKQIAIFDPKNTNKFYSWNFFLFLVIKTLD